MEKIEDVDLDLGFSACTCISSNYLFWVGFDLLGGELITIDQSVQ